MAAANDKVHLNLDTYEVETETTEPYFFVLGDRRIGLSNPRLIAWQDLVSVGDTPIKIFRFVMTEEDRKYFAEYKLSGAKMQVLVDDYFRHYGIELAPGKSLDSLI